MATLERTRDFSQVVDFELIAFLVFYDPSSTDGGTTHHIIETMLKKRGVKVTSQLIYEIMEREGI